MIYTLRCIVGTILAGPFLLAIVGVMGLLVLTMLAFCLLLIVVAIPAGLFSLIMPKPFRERLGIKINIGEDKPKGEITLNQLAVAYPLDAGHPNVAVAKPISKE